MPACHGHAASRIQLARELAEWLVTVDGVRGIHLMGINATASIRTVVEGSTLAAHVAAVD